MSKVRELIGLAESQGITKVQMKNRTLTKWAQVDEFVFEQPDGMPVPALFFQPLDHDGIKLDIVIIANSLGMKHVVKSGAVQRLIKKHTAVLTVDLRGFGETKDQGSNQKYQSHAHRIANVATHIGRPLLGQRVSDLLSVVDYIDNFKATNNIRLIGLQAAAPVALHAAALNKSISKVELEESPVNSWVKDVVAKPLRSNMVDHIIPNALLWYDLPDLAHYLDKRLQH